MIVLRAIWEIKQGRGKGTAEEIILCSVLQFSQYKPFTSSVKFIPRNFILLDHIINEAVFLIFFSDCLFLICRNTTDFCVLILCPATLLKSFISCKSFPVDTLGFSSIRSSHLQIYFCLSDLDAFYFFLLPNFFGWNFQYKFEQK